MARETGRTRSNPKPARQAQIGAAAAAGAAILFGTSYVATAFAERSLSPVAVGFWRGTLATVAMAGFLALAALRRASAGVQPTPAGGRIGWGQLWRLGCLGLLGGTAFVAAMNVAVSLAGASIAAFVAGLYAALAAVIAPAILHERLGPAAIGGFGVALLGTLLLAEFPGAGGSFGGLGAGLAAALAYALYLVLSRRWAAPWRLPATHVTLATFVCTAGGLLAVAAAETAFGAAGGHAFGLVPASIRLDALLGLLWLALLPGIVAQLLIVTAVKRIDARLSSAILLLNPPSAALVAWALLGESLGRVQLGGAALVLLGIGLASGAAGLARRAVATPPGVRPRGPETADRAADRAPAPAAADPPDEAAGD